MTTPERRKRLPDTLIDHGPTVRDEYPRLWVAYEAQAAEIARLTEGHSVLNMDHSRMAAMLTNARAEIARLTKERDALTCSRALLIAESIAIEAALAPHALALETPVETIARLTAAAQGLEDALGNFRILAQEFDDGALPEGVVATDKGRWNLAQAIRQLIPTAALAAWEAR
ncbi:MAG: hypothetical protein WC718_19245 [Phycisphaerales bacterium]|jgi:hypothetical protein